MPEKNTTKAQYVSQCSQKCPHFVLFSIETLFVQTVVPLRQEHETGLIFEKDC